MTDLIAELAEVVELSRTNPKAWIKAALTFMDIHHAELTRILTDYAAILASHYDLVIRLGEVTTELEAAKRDAERYRWLRISACEIAWNEWCSYSPGYSEGGPEELDNAIDAAMRDSAGEDSNE